MKLETIDLKGKAYATVPTRIKEFREANPNGLIETKPDMLGDGQVLFNARILKDKSNPSSGEATGHSIGKLTGDKAFEKLETIAIGRALAILGYMASGDIASSEEMEEFIKSKEDRKKNELEQARTLLSGAKTLKQLQDIFTKKLTVDQRAELVDLKDELKAKLA